MPMYYLQRFRDSLVNVDWRRFKSYAHRVHSLVWNDADGCLADDIFTQVFYHRPHTHPILPNVQRITWKASVHGTTIQVLPMISESLKELRLNCLSGSLIPVLKGIQDRQVQLEAFHLETTLDVVGLNASVSDFLQRQTKLKQVGLPRFFGTEEIASSLGSLPALVKIYSTNDQTENKSGVHWQFDGSNFPALTSFGVCASLTQATEFFDPKIPSRLVTVSIVIPIGPTDAGLAIFLPVLASSCPTLESLSLDLYRNPSDYPAIEFKELRPLLQCRGLKTLEIADRKPLVLKEKHIWKMAEAWPSLRRLDLTPEPIDGVAARFGNSMSLLNTFAQYYGTRLEHLGLYFAPTREDVVGKCGLYTLPHLRHLVVGVSPISQNEVLPLAAFLGGVCRSGMVVKAGRRSWSPPVIQAGWESAIIALWETVAQGMRDVHACQRPLRYKIEVMEQKLGTSSWEVVY